MNNQQFFVQEQDQKTFGSTMQNFATQTQFFNIPSYSELWQSYERLQSLNFLAQLPAYTLLQPQLSPSHQGIFFQGQLPPTPPSSNYLTAFQEPQVPTRQSNPGRRTKSKRKKVPKYKEKKAAKIKQKPVPQDQQIDMNESNQLTIKSWNSPQIEEILRNNFTPKLTFDFKSLLQHQQNNANEDELNQPLINGSNPARVQLGSNSGESSMKNHGVDPNVFVPLLQHQEKNIRISELKQPVKRNWNSTKILKTPCGITKPSPVPKYQEDKVLNDLNQSYLKKFDSAEMQQISDNTLKIQDLLRDLED